ncbi:MAG: hypothetical protein ACK44Q_03005, partial [Pirellulaceae bacterium]
TGVGHCQEDASFLALEVMQMKYVLNAKWLIRSIAGILVGMTTSLAVQAAVVSFGSFTGDFVTVGDLACYEKSDP